MFLKRRSKYNAKKTVQNNRHFDSQLEAKNALWLESLQKQGKIKQIEYQVNVRLNVNGYHVCCHRIDFLVTLPDDRKKYVEIKGMPTNEWKIKAALMRAIYPTPYLVNPNEKELLQ